MTASGPVDPGERSSELESRTSDPVETWADVALALPLRQAFTYRVPRDLARDLEVGARVQVPFGRRRLAGFVVALGPARGTAPAGLRNVAAIVDPSPVLPAELLAVLRKAADYYFHPLGEVLEAALPPGAHAGSTAHLALLPDGARALEAGGLDARSAALMSLLAAGPRPEAAVLRQTSQGPALVRRLRERGWLERLDVVSEPDLGPRTEAWVVATEAQADSTDGRLGARQRQILDRIRQRRQLTLEELRQVHPEARAIVASLVGRGLARLEEREAAPDPLVGGQPWPDSVPEPNDAQRAAVAAIGSALEAGAYQGFLLHGVTGSGKTEVYLRVIDQVLRSGGGAIVLVPEIALTPQLVGRFRARFGDALAVMHSGLADRHRLGAWKALRDGRVRLAVGTRSAIFAPVAGLRLLVVDEEHDPSFKQEDAFRYHARDLALLRASQIGAVAVLGSATPSLESYHNAGSGKLHLLELPERATTHSLPAVEVVDLSRHRRGPTGSPLLSGPLHEALQKTLASGEQAILFLNRRGFAPTVLCEACGEAVRCAECSVGLVHHRASSTVRCHLCDFAATLPTRCARCGQEALASFGIGTEQVESIVRQAFPAARIARLDRDTATARGIEEVLDRLRSREIDVLVGTQMVAKGHDFPGVTLVGVILADHTLSLPDFRAAERTFQLLAQVAGRAGRGGAPGSVVIQTYDPDHFAVRAAAAHSSAAFYPHELEGRAELGYPPFGRLVAIRVDAASEDRARAAADALAQVARRAARGSTVRVTGPAPAPIARIRGRHRFRVFLRSPELRALRAAVQAVARASTDAASGIRVAIDVDPVGML
ncbi:MAG: primosomal protein N' [Deltaproteobacteria bacterium]|nr:primosomal protein N' [Deltaproteobacteria bacterium]